MHDTTKAALLAMIWLYFFALAVIHASLPGIAATIAVLAAVIYADEARERAQKRIEREKIKANFKAEFKEAENYGTHEKI